MTISGNEPVSTSDLLAVLGGGRTMPTVLYSDPTMTTQTFENYGDTYEVKLSQPVSDFMSIIVFHFSEYKSMGTTYHAFTQVYPSVFLESPGTYYPKLTTNYGYDEAEFPISVNGNTLQVSHEDNHDWTACIYMVIGLK